VHSQQLLQHKLIYSHKILQITNEQLTIATIPHCIISLLLHTWMNLEIILIYRSFCWLYMHRVGR